MKRLLLAVSGMTLLINGMACVGPETSVMDQGQTHQKQRIEQRMANGQLNEGDARRFNEQQGQVNTMENRAKTDSVMTALGRARISAAQARISRHNIAREEYVHQGKRRR